MKNSLLLTFLFLFVSFASVSQRKLLVGGGMDLYRTDKSNPFKAQRIGMEVNFFPLKHVALTGGMEVWPDPNTTFMIFGARVYPAKPFFLRLRGLARDEVEFSVGSGYSIALVRRLWLELSGDYYFEPKLFAFRGGFAFGF